MTARSWLPGAASWLCVGCLLALTVVSATRLALGWTLLAGVVSLLAAGTALTRRRWWLVPVALVAAAPVHLRLAEGAGWLAGAAGGAPALHTALPLFVDTASLTAVTLLVVGLLQRTTRLRLSRYFGVVFVFVLAVGTVAGWAILRWLGQRYLGVEAFAIPGNRALMFEFAVSTLAVLTVTTLLGWRWFPHPPSPAVEAP